MKRRERKVKNIALLILYLSSPLGSQLGFAQEEMPEMPKPTEQHDWLQKLVGEWTTATEIYLPGGEIMNTTGTESVRSIGGFWVVNEGDSSGMGLEFNSILTIGYSPDKGHFIGTWIDSLNPDPFLYTGSLNSNKETLTLETEGPCPMKDGAITKFKEVIEIENPDHRVFTSYYEGDDGEWIKGLVTHSRRAK